MRKIGSLTAFFKDFKQIDLGTIDANLIKNIMLGSQRIPTENTFKKRLRGKYSKTLQKIDIFIILIDMCSKKIIAKFQKSILKNVYF